jgi:hypothetical protein
MTIEIKLTKGLTTIVDDDDAELAELKWSAAVRKTTQYAQYGASSKKTRLLHRVIMERIQGRELERREVVDHIDHNGLNNTRSNLRLVTQRENMANSRLFRNNTSGFRGVSWYTGIKRWVAKIRIGDRFIHLGCFDTAVEAAKKYNEAAFAHFGHYALLNVIPDEAQS